MSIKIGIMGYGNLGRGIENAIKQNPDMELVAVFTRRAPESLKIKDGIMLIEIMKEKAKELNKRFHTDFWTPRKIDMVLWSFGR